MPDYPTATVREVNGQLVLNDPVAVEVVKAIEKHNLKATFDFNHDRIEHFKRRIVELRKSPADLAIVVLNVNDPHGGLIADALMPGHNWDEIRARGEIPFARGLAMREGMQGAVDAIDKEAGDKLRTAKTAVIVMDFGVVDVFDAGE
jgi:hypothetical protein